MSKNKGRVANTIVPGDIFHPGEHLKDEIDAREMTQQDLAEKLHVSKSEVSLLIHGKRNITPGIAIRLENALNINAEFWMNLQIKYDIDILKKKYKDNLKRLHISTKRKEEMNSLIASI